MSIFLSQESKIPVAFLIHGIYKEIGQIVESFKVEDYGNIITDIGIIPNCIPQDMIDDGFGKERRYICYKKNSADIRLRIDFDKFLESDKQTRKLMYIKNIIDSIKVIDERVNKKAKNGFDGERLSSDILKALNLSLVDLESI